jgi:hypothetical protein
MLIFHSITEWTHTEAPGMYLELQDYANEDKLKDRDII